MDEYPGEVFINPNTVSLYDESKSDYLIGDFITHDDEAYDVTRASENGDGHQSRIAEILIDYALDEVDGSGGGNNSSNVVYKTEVSDWRTVKTTEPLLRNYVRWNQNKPFNNQCPTRRKYGFFGNKRTAYAGCFPLSISKIMTLFEYPTHFQYNGFTVNYDKLKYYNSSNNDFCNNAAALLRGIGVACDSWYFYEGTFTFPSEVTSFMRSIGYTNAHSKDYCFSRVKDMIDNGRPLIIYAVPGINITSSHAWNIDGYKIKVRTITKKRYENGVYKSETTEQDTCKMVHCDFGWGGSSNGYYVDGVFNLKDSNAELDNKSDKGQNKKYNNLKKVITYDAPY